MNVAVIGCAPSEIMSACQHTISRLVKEGHKIYTIIASSSNPTEPSESSSPFSEIRMVPKLTAIGVTRTFLIENFDYSAITQINADAVNSYIKGVEPSLVIMPSWKSPNNMRRILAENISYCVQGNRHYFNVTELDAENTSFNPTITFEMSSAPASVQVNNNVENSTKELEINTKAFTNDSVLVSKTSQTNRYKGVEEKFESHRTILLEEQGLF